MILLFNLSLSSLEFFSKLRDDLKQVVHDAVVSDLEYGSLGVLIDGDNYLRVLHASEVLYGAADAHGEVQIRGHDFTRLAHLHIIGHVSGVNGGPRGSDRTVLFAQDACEVVENLEVLSILHAAASTHHELSG